MVAGGCGCWWYMTWVVAGRYRTGWLFLVLVVAVGTVHWWLLVNLMSGGGCCLGGG